MQYKNKRQVKVGDQVVGRISAQGNPIAGVVVAMNEEATENIAVVPGINQCQDSAANFLHVDDALPVVRERT